MELTYKTDVHNFPGRPFLVAGGAQNDGDDHAADDAEDVEDCEDVVT